MKLRNRILAILIAIITITALLPLSVTTAAAERPPIQSIEITVDHEIDPVTGETPTPESDFKIEGVNGLGNKAGYDLILHTYWYRSDDPEMNPMYAEDIRYSNQTTFVGGYYYTLVVNIYCFGYGIEGDTVYKIKTPTKTYECGPISIHDKGGSGFRGAGFTFSRTEGEPKKPFGETLIDVSGYAEGAKAGDIVFTAACDGATLAEYKIYCSTDGAFLNPTDVIEKDKSYGVMFTLMSKDGYTLMEFGPDSYYRSNVADKNGRNAAFIGHSYEFSEVEVLKLYYMLEPITDGLKQIKAPNIGLRNYNVGGKVTDLALKYNAEELSSEINEYFEDYFAESKGNCDGIIDVHEEFYLALEVELTPGYSFDGITKDLFEMNGIIPDYMEFKVDADKNLLTLCYNLPVFHEPTAEWKSDADSHWNECTCGEKLNITAHTDGDLDGKCDGCSSDFVVTSQPDPEGNGNGGVDFSAADSALAAVLVTVAALAAFVVGVVVTVIVVVVILIIVKAIVKKKKRKINKNQVEEQVKEQMQGSPANNSESVPSEEEKSE